MTETLQPDQHRQPKDASERLRRRAMDRVRKCLALANSSNPHEAEAALRQARKLMDMHKLQQSDVLASAVEERDIKVSNSIRVPQKWVLILSGLVAEAFGCAYIMKRSGVSGASMCFIGPSGSSEMAVYAYEVLTRQLTAARKQYLKTLPGQDRGYKRRAGARYAEQWLMTVKKKVQAFAGMDEETSRAVDAYMAKEYPALSVTKPKMRKLREDELHAAMAGAEDGEKVSLHIPMGSESRVRLGKSEDLAAKIVALMSGSSGSSLNRDRYAGLFEQAAKTGRLTLDEQLRAEAKSAGYETILDKLSELDMETRAATFQSIATAIRKLKEAAA